MSKTWIFSDPHAYHKGITRGESHWDDKTGCRDFDSAEEMTQAVITGLNKYIKSNDIAYCLGDWAFDGKQNIWNFRKQLNCKNIHLMTGNHDDHIIKNSQLEIPKNEFDLFCSITGYYPDYSRQFNGVAYVNAQELFSSVNQAQMIKFGKKQRAYVHHWPLRSWWDMKHGVWHVYGHEHGNIEHLPWSKSLDGGVDNAFRLYGEYRPFDYDMIEEQLKDRPIFEFGHHTLKNDRP